MWVDDKLNGKWKKDKTQIKMKSTNRISMSDPHTHTHTTMCQGKSLACSTRLRFHVLAKYCDNHMYPVPSCSRKTHAKWMRFVAVESPISGCQNRHANVNDGCSSSGGGSSEVNAFKVPSKNIKMNVPPTEFFVCHCHSFVRRSSIQKRQARA